MGKPDEVRSVCLQGDLVTTGNYFFYFLLVFIFYFLFFFFWEGEGEQHRKWEIWVGKGII